MEHLPYLELYKLLKHKFASAEREINIPELQLKITSSKFRSAGSAVLPGKNNYYCRKHDISFSGETTYEGLPETEERSILLVHDSEISCNEEFDYIIINNNTPAEAKSAIILFHGLNEKKWDKYLPWAYRLLKNTGKPVILFPLAFHMDRAPKEWSVAANMNAAAKERAHTDLLNSHTSFVNAAISSRLEANPQRFFWSGLHSYIDVSVFLHELNRGRVKGFAAGTAADIFGYSIGAYFGLILIMAGAGGLTENSKLFTFCGGATLDRMYPISKYILDAHAASAISSYYLELLNNDFKGTPRMQHYLSAEHPEEGYFKSMLLYHHFKELREGRLRQISARIRSAALKHDSVVPPVEVMNTLQGEMRDIDITVDIEDFPYPYSHVNPFSPAEKHSIETNNAFVKIMDKASEFLG
ncbi:MAG TPA: DUF6051 family protein [Ignavibacteria bacterium]|nr:DUF6051 family protein [Ignavibacteria bacterium]HMQ97628.1 DUF6051 family protein [Ignavibacteria bacterium]